ncbi:LPXTG-motif cell wall anchor domain protein [Brevibacterium mcbrellneri ATCC 49030]|uniref:LPXTG-motif cell wall anchor domain protein n=1 Tax=Brevibacterium mcbrellneri ATCC 49030 TaxID=585530 RepID=D4YLM1_9MICO|nr:Ig-like domain-containing protein [Brevibacterium mcbrellneri]EFG47938.1 LPXTG-motif cell wall anchor domain protein [Brevibacterium mcbrellneri ATCC 49030]
MTVPATRAIAAINENIEITITSFKKINDRNEPQDGQLYQYDLAQLDFKWDASNADPKPGDQFSIEFPPELKMKDSGTFPLQASDGKKYGECLVEDTKITCTFNDNIAGKTDIKGSGNAVVSAEKASESNQLDFTINGKKTAVTAPDDKPIGSRDGYEEWQTDKWAPKLNANSTELNWQIAFNADVITRESGQNLDNVDLTFIDKAGPGQVFVETDSKWFIKAAQSADNPDLHEPITDASGEQFTQDYGDLKLTVTLNDAKTEATINIKGSMKSGINYSLIYHTQPSNGKISKGFVYKNSVSGTGIQGTLTKKTSYIEAFTIGIELKDGFGNFDIAKRIEGPGSGHLAEGTKFDVAVAWSLPDGKKPEDYDWEIPDNPMILPITVGETTVSTVQFPVGTKITLIEDPNTANPKNESVTFGTPTFTVGESTGETAEFVIENKSTKKVNLTNQVDTVPEPTPEPSEEPTPEPSEEPTPEPSEEPTPEPSEEPTPEPSEEPTPEPSEEPTPEPSEEPTPEPSEEPTPEPSEEPTPEPSEEPTQETPIEDSGNDNSPLPRTGSNVGLGLLAAVTLICGGVVMLVASRKRGKMNR